MGTDAAAAAGLTVREVRYEELEPIVEERGGRYMDDEPTRTWFGAFVGEELVGCCSVQVLDHPTIATYRNDYVCEGWRRRGVYQALFRARLDWCRAHGVRVVSTRCTAASLSTYLRWGFVRPPDWPDLAPVIGSVDRLQEPDMSEWPYLKTEVMRSRQALAAYFLSDGDIIEVGGGDTPIAGAFPFDPRVDNPEVVTPYGLALLGLDLRDMTEEAWARLERVVRGARRVVLEYAEDWRAGAEQARRIATMGLTQIVTVGLDCHGNAMPGGGHPPRLRRRLLVLERAE